MRSSFAATSLELEAARRREVLESHPGAMQLRATVPDPGRRIVPRAAAWIAQLTSTDAGPRSYGSESSAQCAHPAGPVRPGS
jgi:hypothetical protein